MGEQNLKVFDEKLERGNSKVCEFVIFPSLHEEAKEGWVWLPQEFEGWEGSVIEITNLENGKSVVCECRVVDSNYSSIYKKGALPTKKDLRQVNQERLS